ncbi:hypothetical protein CQ046_10945 [Chryseobacterium sp. MYb7]|uniref:hypothetical protein n=1 Tax=Chryseobacterium sp. MYb7 TaxID=1827290 RepID=UPI000D002203|nr:hypothetical protein [Chryseobacterium sp. MYb7]PRB03064.1 hypothetical protein CQ046_10945 [Chryseobacterium sp. MYb7]
MDKEKLFFNAKINLKNSTMNKTNATVSKARDLFQKLPIETQKKIKNDAPETYQAIFGKELIIETSILENFFDEYEPLNEKIKTFQDLEKLPLEKQLSFKENFPKEYAEIMNTESKK